MFGFFSLWITPSNQELLLVLYPEINSGSVWGSHGISGIGLTQNKHPNHDIFLQLLIMFISYKRSLPSMPQDTRCGHATCISFLQTLRKFLPVQVNSLSSLNLFNTAAGFLCRLTCSHSYFILKNTHGAIPSIILSPLQLSKIFFFFILNFLKTIHVPSAFSLPLFLCLLTAHYLIKLAFLKLFL